MLILCKNGAVLDLTLVSLSEGELLTSRLQDGLANAGGAMPGRGVCVRTSGGGVAASSPKLEERNSLTHLISFSLKVQSLKIQNVKTLEM